jgi:hypothetical protein
MPTMMMGSAATFIDCDECWKLLLVTRKGTMYVWDLYNRNCLLHDSLGSLVALNPNSSAKDAGITNSQICLTRVLLFIIIAEKPYTVYEVWKFCLIS